MSGPTTEPPAHTNRLASESSPYLLQHAHNPVDWRPWGAEAIAEARDRDVPIFLSVGYSTCYWCHVMERESFEDERTARVMNDLFVCVKVDREERPDIDDLYMAATTIMTGHGGWPMSVFIEPEHLRPFFCGTYFPIAPRQGLPSFTQVLEGMSDAWKTKRDEVLEQAGRLADAVRAQLAESEAPVPVGAPSIARAIRMLLQMLDKANGGFGGAPKFPQPALLEFLLEARRVTDEQTVVAIDHALRTTLDAMMLGGIHDHVGGGFHRYAVDQTWTVPHFEKMLYDNGQLLSLYATAARVYADAEYERVVRRTADYLQREMTGSQGEFFSAQDAEVRGREGLNYLWNRSELDRVLAPDDAAFAAELYGIDAGTNFQDPHHPGDSPSNVLRLETRLDRTAERRGMEMETLTARLDAINDRLRAARDRREQPGLDDKVLTAWNGLAIAGLADAAALLNDASLYGSAASAGEHIMRVHRTGDMTEAGVLLRSTRGGSGAVAGFLDDHAMLAAGLLGLARHADRFGADADRYVSAATEIVHLASDAFGAPDGGFFDTRAGQNDLFVRARSAHDGAVPAGVGVMLGVLLELHRCTGDEDWLVRAGRCMASVSAHVAHNPVGCVNATKHLIGMLPLRNRLATLGVEVSFDEPEHAPQPAARTTQAFGVFADRERVAVGPDVPAEFRVLVRIKPGYHVLSAEPDPDGVLGSAGAGLVPLRVGLISGQGIAVYSDYPAGTPIGVEGVGRVLAHEGEVELRIAVEHAPGIGAGPGRPVLGLTAQACSDTACERATTVELDVAIDLASDVDAQGAESGDA